jgi:hypothetical protein
MLIYNERACATGADVNAEDVNGSLFLEARSINAGSAKIRYVYVNGVL